MTATVCNPIYQGWYHRFPALFSSKEKALCGMSDKCEQIAWRNNFAAYGKEYYQKHNEVVRKLALDEDHKPLGERKFLEWNLGEGWTRLAAFLNHEIPKKPYPGGNGVAEFVEEADTHAREMWVATGKKLLSWSVVGGAVVVSMIWMRSKVRST